MWLVSAVGGTAIGLFVIVVGFRGFRILFKATKVGLNKLDEWIEDKIKG